ncbi:cation diffusion facilitator family transporter [Thiohalocapsa marina]|uniref:Cation-efflux pump FieF n=1 Tax=Thiohalocapsa marina TaxID=424902 RepID=A0A5M8FLE7_9GAMM|nr:cation diffusion facilitator family transporter [Thiohalocapsa marina]KAA6185668.1 cation diffusion facilitator family transporter [Thiohalocapsa marina]
MIEPTSSERPASGLAQSDPLGNGRLLRLATYASVSTATLLILVKLIAWLATGSVSVLASLVDSIMDVGASLVNLLAVHWSLKPADAEHRFGHGKAQPLAALGQSAFIAGSALFVGLEAVNRLIHPRPVADAGIGLFILGFAMVATLALLVFQHSVIRRTGSTAIRADALHYATDLATNGATLLALGLAWFGWHGADPILGFGIAAFVLLSAVRIGHDAVQLLLDRELPQADRDEITALAKAGPEVRGIHGLRTRRSGQLLIIQLHLELDDQLPLSEAHRITLEAEQRIRARYPESDIIVHQDPASLGDEHHGTSHSQ